VLILIAILSKFLFRPLFLIALIYPFSIVLGQDDSSENLSIEQNLALAAKYEATGDFKEATRYMNAAGMKTWDDKNYVEAIKYFNLSINLNRHLSNESGIAKLNSNLGMIYSDIKDFQKSLHYFQLALDYRLAHGEKSEIISTYINQSVVLNSLGRYNDAVKKLEEALRLATEMADIPQMKSCYGMLAETYQKAGNEEKTLYYYQFYVSYHEKLVRDNLKVAKQETEIAKLQALQLELEKKDQELMLLTKSKELEASEVELRTMNADMRELVEGKSKQELAIKILEEAVKVDELKIAYAIAENKAQRFLIGVIATGLIMSVFIVVLLQKNSTYKKKVNERLSEQNIEITKLNDTLESKVQERTSQLQKTLVDLENRNRDLDQFSHVISHNLRGPVASILGLGRVFNKVNYADPINRDVINRLMVASKDLDDVVKDLSIILSVKGNMSVPQDRVVVRDVFNSVISRLHSEIAESKAQIILKDDEGNELRSVKPYIDSILYNLLLNSISYRSKDKALVIKIEAIRGADNFRLSVEDNGLGIEDEYVSKLFEPYKRFTLTGEGKGLGLYMLKTQVESMGGSIQVSSRLNQGTKFSIQLPQNP
jgi:signal transduction histidine kinase